MVDLHCHILPGIDDGAKTLEESLFLLREELKQGVDQIVLTPHFNPENITVKEFERKRREAFSLLSQSVQKENLPVQLKLGAEVQFSAMLPELDLSALLIEGTSYLLIEFSPCFYPAWTKDILYQLRLKGIVPILAHVERYAYLMDNPKELFELVSEGTIVQVNASSVLRKGSKQQRIQKLLRWNLIHILSTDTHSIDKRPPLMESAFKQIENWCGQDKVQRLKQAGADVFAARELQADEAICPKKILGRWF